MNYKTYQKLKAMQTFRQKFSDMIREYRDGYRMQQREKKTAEVRPMPK